MENLKDLAVKNIYFSGLGQMALLGVAINEKLSDELEFTSENITGLANVINTTPVPYLSESRPYLMFTPIQGGVILTTENIRANLTFFMYYLTTAQAQSILTEAAKYKGKIMSEKEL